MTDMQDPFNILRDHNPADEATIDPHGPEATRILTGITSTPTSPVPHTVSLLARTRQHRTVALVAGVLVLILVSAAAWVIATRTIDDPSVTCYEAPSLGSDRVGTVADRVPTPDACIPYWQDGTLELLTQPGTVPPLVGCVTPDGGLAVFPTNDPTVCQRLGLANPSDDQPTNDLEAITAVQVEITDYILSAACRPIDEAKAMVRAILDRNGLTEWTTEVAEGPPGDKCASINYRTSDKSIDIVPIP